MSDTLYERYNTGDNVAYGTYGNFWRAQSFTIGNTGTNENHNITSVKLKLQRSGSPGTITVSIRAVDVNGQPTGDDLTSGTTNGNTLSEVEYEMREITLTPYQLQASTKYAIVFRALDGNVSNFVYIRADNSSPTYTGGIYHSSSSSGSTWTDYTTRDLIFEEYGTTAGGATLEQALSDTLSLSESIQFDIGMKLADNQTLSETLQSASTFNLNLTETLILSESIKHDIAIYLSETLDLSEDAAVELTAAIIKIMKGATPKKLGIPTPQNIGVGF